VDDGLKWAIGADLPEVDSADFWCMSRVLTVYQGRKWPIFPPLVVDVQKCNTNRLLVTGIKFCANEGLHFFQRRNNDISAKTD
jgi:hypothetical protein